MKNHFVLMAETVEQEVIELESRVRKLVDEVIDGRDLFVVEIDIRGQKGSRAVDIFLDNDDGIGIDTLARVSREIGFLLETEDAISGRYNLNVSSPGADRPLLHPRQYLKHVGRPLRVEHAADDTGRREVVVGDLREVHDNAIVISAGPDQTVRVEFNDIETARVQLPW